MLSGKCNLFEVVFGSNWHICQEAAGPCVWTMEVGLWRKAVVWWGSTAVFLFLAAGHLWERCFHLFLWKHFSRPYCHSVCLRVWFSVQDSSRPLSTRILCPWFSFRKNVLKSLFLFLFCGFQNASHDSFSLTLLSRALLSPTRTWTCSGWTRSSINYMESVPT